MANPFFEHPILNSPYQCPTRHWELDEHGQPTQKIKDARRSAEFITPIPKPKKQKASKETQKQLVYNEGVGLSTKEQQYDVTAVISEVRRLVADWRTIPNSSNWNVTPETTRLLQHWRHHEFTDIRPFFCQVEAVETAIWLTKVAPKTAAGKRLLDDLNRASEQANPGLTRLALKLATGAGKTTVMTMLIAWQTINAVRRPNSKLFTRGFLIVTPGLTIKDRLRVLQPNDPDSYYSSRDIVPSDMLDELHRAKIVITNYHAFKLRERIELSKGGRQLLQGRLGDELNTLETEGQMLQRVMPDLMGMKNILAINDEAHHCYREKPPDADDEELKGDEKKEAEKNNEAARLWISGLEAVNRKLGLARVFDLSATPFFLRGSGYGEGTLFHWTASDFSLMDAIECGIVKLPRVPVADNIPGNEMPMFRNPTKVLQPPAGGSPICPTPSGKSQILQTPSAKSALQLITAFPLSWSHYVRLMAVEKPHARAFYETEAIRGGWSVRQLDRQISTQFFERTSHSKRQTGMLVRGRQSRPDDFVSVEEEVRDPYLLEFLNLTDEYSETELENALIEHLESFLLELGAGFTFVARQKRIRIGDGWYWIDLLLFHRRLRCLVVVDLKIGKFTHADAGQMNLYLNYTREHMMEPGENPPVGLILCSAKNDAVVHYAMGEINARVFASKYGSDRSSTPHVILLRWLYG
jgi:predicted nuclease of restriction endonuclease-like (RecB) superfamily